MDRHISLALRTVALICGLGLALASCRSSDNEVSFDSVDGRHFSWGQRRLIQSTLDVTVREVRRVLPRLPSRVKLRVRAGKNVIAETGEGASVSPPDVVYWTVDPNRKEGVAAIVQHRLRGTLYHEFHHLVRAASLGAERGLLDDVVAEGLATVFERDFAHVAVPWGDYPTDVAAWASELRAVGEEASRDHWMIRHPDGRRWIGYKVGTYWIDCATRASGKSVVDLVSLPTAEILRLAGRSPRPSELAAAPTPVPALDYIANVFDRHPVVALSEVHGNRESAAFLSSLIRHEGFSRRVNDIVIEFGNAAYQPVVDRYIAGEPVDRNELRGTWENTTQISGIWSLPQYEELLADIRAVNATLPATRRYRVLLGDPPIDWRTVTRPSDEDMNDWRDAHVAFVVERHVMARHRRALIYFGGAHFGRKGLFPNSAIHLLDARMPGKTFVVGTLDVGQVQPNVAAAVRDWPTPSIVEVLNTSLGRSDVSAIGYKFSRGLVQDDVDALLLMSAAPLVMQPPPAIDAAMLGEFERRRRLAAATAPFRAGLIRFEPDSTGLTPASAAPLQQVVTELLRDDGNKVLVKAFADAREREPLALSSARAKAVVDRLTAAGVSSTRLAARGCGAARPLWTDETPEHQAANRRVEIVTQTPTAGCEPPRSFEVAPTPP